ncbi:MAG: hypothetical protein D6808_02400 [Candidatus Dadabacteria bacterium]|nr:MAG: hypothetical protein D6808_02400 [Candidatus Dadabacteria bacterium]
MYGNTSISCKNVGGWVNRFLFWAIIFCALISAAGCKESILHNLSESEANRLMTELYNGGIKADKALEPDGKWSIKVESSDVLKAIDFIDKRRLVRSGDSSLPKKSSVISSRQDQRFRFERALSGEIEKTLDSIDGVFESRVHLNLPPVDPIFGRRLGQEHGSASVLLIVASGFGVDERKIKELVAGAAGIDVSKVLVLITSSGGNTVETAPVVATVVPKQRDTGFAEILNSAYFQIPASILILACGAFVVVKRKKKDKLVERLDVQFESLGEA